MSNRERVSPVNMWAVYAFCALVATALIAYGVWVQWNVYRWQTSRRPGDNRYASYGKRIRGFPPLRVYNLHLPGEFNRLPRPLRDQIESDYLAGSDLLPGESVRYHGPDDVFLIVAFGQDRAEFIASRVSAAFYAGYEGGLRGGDPF